MNLVLQGSRDRSTGPRVVPQLNDYASEKSYRDPPPKSLNSAFLKVSVSDYIISSFSSMNPRDAHAHV